MDHDGCCRARQTSVGATVYRSDECCLVDELLSMFQSAEIGLRSYWKIIKPRKDCAGVAAKLTV